MKRLDQYLSENSILTRSKAKDAVRSGRVTVNAVKAKDPAMKIGDDDEVMLDKEPVTATGPVYIVMNKPAGILSATEDGKTRTVLDLVKESEIIPDSIKKKDLFPIGRLDKDTEGLLIITDDGKLSHDLLSPAKHVEKTYFAVCTGEPAKDAAERFRDGIMVGEDYRALPAKLQVVSQGNGRCELLITLIEGRFHQVKRMCHEIGAEVEYLKRVSFGNLKLPEDLRPGDLMLMPDFPEKVRN
ncbi:MAG: rRNA pseudouridine synthase [Lachnospiraceae bacterium]|nr:rRNA pseudouridine synthase [Lachnospiraceae bacterium]